MSLQMVHINERDIEGFCHTFCEIHSHEKRAHQARTACESDSRQLFLCDAGFLQGMIYYRNDILLVCS